MIGIDQTDTVITDNYLAAINSLFILLNEEVQSAIVSFEDFDRLDVAEELEVDEGKIDISFNHEFTLTDLSEDFLENYGFISDNLDYLKLCDRENEVIMKAVSPGRIASAIYLNLSAINRDRDSLNQDLWDLHEWADIDPKIAIVPDQANGWLKDGQSVSIQGGEIFIDRDVGKPEFIPLRAVKSYEDNEGEQLIELEYSRLWMLGSFFTASGKGLFRTPTTKLSYPEGESEDILEFLDYFVSAYHDKTI